MTIIADAKVRVLWPAQQHVPLGGHYNLFRDDRDGVIDYDTPVNPIPVQAWPDGEGKVGFGLGGGLDEDGQPLGFGQGAFGYGAGGARFGQGGFGLGMHGFGAELHEYVTAPLADGTYRMAVVGYDGAGNRVTPADVEVEVAVAGAPAPPGRPTAATYDQPMDRLTLNWPLSKDDEEA